MSKRKKLFSTNKKAETVKESTVQNSPINMLSQIENSGIVIFDEVLKERLDRGIGGIRITKNGIPDHYHGFFARTFELYPIEEIKFYQIVEMFDELGSRELLRIKFLFSHEKSNSAFQILALRKPVQLAEADVEFEFEVENFGTADDLKLLFNSSAVPNAI